MVGVVGGSRRSAKLGGVMGILSIYRMSKAAVIVQNLLEMHAETASVRQDAGAYANKWVGLTFSRKPQMMNGHYGKRPHKLAVAAYALATGISEAGNSREVQAVAIAGLSAIMSDVATNGRLYGFNGTDEVLLELADLVFLAMLPTGAAAKPVQRTATIPAAKLRQPDMAFAARGFAAVALATNDTPRDELYAIADGCAEPMLDAGCTTLQALSARWGGVTAIDADISLYKIYIQSYVEVMNEERLKFSRHKDSPSNKFHMGATTYLAHIIADAPAEFERYLKYMLIDV